MQNLRTPAERLRWAREAAKLTQQGLATLCGWESQSRISHYENGKRAFDQDDVKLLVGALKSRGLQMTRGWLLFGEGESPVPNSLEPGPDVQGMVPLISWVQAGKFSEVSDPFPPGTADEWYPYPRRRGVKSIVALRVKGDSMTAPYGKSYPEGSIIFVDLEQRTPITGQRVIAKLKDEEEATFKVFVSESGRKWLKPLNPQHPPLTVPFRVVGTVVGKWEDE